jgi:hypothetical protein
VVPGGALEREQISAPELQAYVPGLQVEPQLTPTWVPQDPPAEPAVPLVPAVAPATPPVPTLPPAPVPDGAWPAVPP